MVTNTETKPPPPTEKQIKLTRTLRFTDYQWACLGASAAAEGIGLSEYLRRIIDIHYARKDLEDRFVASLLKVEQRVDALEKMIEKA